MAKTTEQILQEIIGGFVFQIATVQGRVEQLTEEIQELKDKLKVMDEILETHPNIQP